MAKFLQFILYLLDIVGYTLSLYKYVLLASVLVSWVNADPYNPIVNFIYRVTDPVLRRIRAKMPATGAIDFSPMIAFALITAIQYLVLDVATLYIRSAFTSIALPTFRGF